MKNINKKTIFTLILILASSYLIYWIVTRPEQKLGEITFPSEKSTIQIDSQPQFIGSFSRKSLDTKLVNVYSIKQNTPLPIPVGVAREIASELGFITPNVIENNYSGDKIYLIKDETKILSINELGTFVLNFPTKLNLEITQNQLIQELDKLGLTQILDLPVNYQININKTEFDSTEFEIVSLLPDNNKIRTNSTPFIYWGRVQQSEQEGVYQITVNANLNFDISIIEQSTYELINLEEAINIANSGSDQLIIDIEAEERVIDLINANKLFFNKAGITYFIQGNLLVPYIELSGHNKFNKVDEGIVKVYVPAIKSN